MGGRSRGGGDRDQGAIGGTPALRAAELDGNDGAAETFGLRSGLLARFGGDFLLIGSPACRGREIGLQGGNVAFGPARRLRKASRSVVSAAACSRVWLASDSRAARTC